MFLLISCALFSLLLLPRISIHLMFLLIRELDQKVRKQIDYFNTSYVSINHEAMTMKSWKNPISIHLMFLLIVFWQSWHLPGTNFNTSHVSINLLSWSGAYFQYIHFNTSHVSINPLPQCVYRLRQKISIHLMFLLINGGMEQARVLSRFQYISCFY